MTNLLKEINNPGKGNCAFYGFSIGLISIIKREMVRDKKSATFTLLKNSCLAFDKDFDIDITDILSFNYSSQSPVLLNKMQMHLREILYRHRIQDLVNNRNNLSASRTFCNFSAMARGSGLPDFNELVKSKELQQYTVETANKIKRHKKWFPDDKNTQRFIDSIVEKSFISDVFEKPDVPSSIELNQKSLVVTALKEVTTNYRWGTQRDLNELASIFKVNLHTLVNGESLQAFRDEPSRPVITMNNKHNMHWTTKLPFLPDNFSGKKYDDCTRDICITKREIKAILSSYTTGFRSIFTKRNHERFAMQMIGLCKNSQVDVNEIVKQIRDYAHDNLFADNSSIKKRLNYILARADYSKEEQPESLVVENQSIP